MGISDYEEKIVFALSGDLISPVIKFFFIDNFCGQPSVQGHQDMSSKTRVYLLLKGGFKKNKNYFTSLLVFVANCCTVIMRQKSSYKFDQV